MPPAVVADLRSDTVTKPTAAMRQAIASATVGDDVLGDDPTVIELQEKSAELLGKEDALFVPSGTMANQIAIRIQTSPGDQIICHQDSHAFFYESGAPAALSGVSARFLDGHRGQYCAADVRRILRPPNSHFARDRLIIIENTHNRGGGSVWPIDKITEVSEVAQRAGLSMHLDGARLMNACVAGGRKPADYAQHFDTVSMCFSKGLGAPVGSILAGSKELIKKAHRFRKMFGGGMRQAGILAAAAIHALDHHVERLADDHANAKKIAAALFELPKVSINVEEVDTNILYFNLDDDLGTAPEICQKLADEGVLLLPESERRVRAVTHLDVSAKQIDEAIKVLSRILQ